MKLYVREQVKSKFLCQEADVMSLSDKCIVVRCFVCGVYDQILMEMELFSDNIRVTENGLVSGADRVRKYSNLEVFDRLDPLRQDVNFDVFFDCPPSGILFTCIHDNAIVRVPWI